MIIAKANPWPAGPFSAVRPLDGRTEAGQEPAESAAPEPVDEVLPASLQQSSQSPFRGTMSSQSMAEQGQRSAGQGLAAFPQIVHLLANPELHFGETLASETGLPLVSLQETSVEDLRSLLAEPQFADGFILEGFPTDRAGAESLDGLLSATDPNGRRVLGWDSEQPQQQEIVDHYVNQGLMWAIPAPQHSSSPEKVKSTMLECLIGLPALN